MLKLPLTSYDESGRILPPRWLYSVLILLCIDWLAFIFSVASRTQTSELLAFFYPQKETLGLGLAASLPVLISLILVSQRDRLWKNGYLVWRRWVIPLAQLGVLALLSVQLYYTMHHHWGFEYITGVKIVFYAIALYAISKSRHLKWMVEDWETPNPWNTVLGGSFYTQSTWCLAACKVCENLSDCVSGCSTLVHNRQIHWFGYH